MLDARTKNKAFIHQYKLPKTAKTFTQPARELKIVKKDYTVTVPYTADRSSTTFQNLLRNKVNQPKNVQIDPLVCENRYILNCALNCELFLAKSTAK